MAFEKAEEYATVAFVLFFMLYIFLASIYVIYVFYRLLLPDWLIFPLLFTAFIYFLDTLPFQHHWNPIVRELYPRRQWKIERVAMNMLRRMHILSESQRSQPSKRLPAELWSSILDHAIDVPFVFDTACDAKRFNLFISSQTFQTYSWEYSLSEGERKKLRLVCGMWASLLDQRKTRWLASPHSWKNSGTRIVRADLQVGPTSLNPITFDPPFVGIVESMAASSKQVASLTTLALRKYLHVFPGNTHESFREHFLPHARELSSIRSLIFGWERIVPANFLSGIQQSFANTTFLHLEGDFAEGILTLDRLDVLHLDVFPLEVRRWWFPSLRHLALGSRYLSDRSLDTELIPAVTEQLLSILLPNEHAILHVDNGFWIQFSSLEFLGVRLDSFSVVDDPPAHHPLTHLCLAEAYTYETLGKSKINITALDLEHLSTTVSRLPALQLVTMPTVADQLKDRYPTEWREAFKKHQLRGLMWLDETGKPIDALKHRKVRRHRWWERKAHLAYVGYCTFTILATLYRLPSPPTSSYQLLLAPLYVLPLVYTLWTTYDLRTAE